MFSNNHTNLDDQDINLLRKTLNHSGFCIVPDVLGSHYCNEMIDKIDQYTQTHKVEKNYFDTEARVWNSEHCIDGISEFKEFCENLYLKILNKKGICNVLAIRNFALSPDQ